MKELKRPFYSDPSIRDIYQGDIYQGDIYQGDIYQGDRPHDRHTLERGFGTENLRYCSSLLHHYLASMRYLEQYRHATNDEETVNVVDAAIHYMNENLENRIKIQDVINYVGYSPTRFLMLFKKQTGSTALQYFNRLKIERACSLLKETDMKINQICYKIGIEDSLYFSRLFSKAMGLSPREYRNTHLSGGLSP